MSCGLTSCSDGFPFQPDKGSNASIKVASLQIEPDEFEREELQDIRDRARRLSIQGSPAKTVEERLYQELADVTDQLDAFAAREEAAVKEAFGNVTVINNAPPSAPYDACSPTHRHSSCHHRPFLGGYGKKI